MSAVVDFIELAALRYPEALRRILEVARERGPILGDGNNVLVTGAAEVREVLDRPDDFLFGVVHAKKMKLGRFLLGMDVSPTYEAEKRALRQVVTGRQPVDHFAALVRKHCGPLIGRMSATVDLTTGFIEPVIVAAAAEFYGIELSGAASAYINVAPGHPTFTQWMRKLGSLLPSAAPAPFGLEQLTDALGGEMLAFLSDAVSDVPPATSAKFESVVANLKWQASQPDAALTKDDDIVRCVGGLMLAGSAMAKAAALAIHQLVRCENRKAAVEYAALSGNVAEVAAHAWEALRFQPVFPLLPRYCPRLCHLRTTRGELRSIPAGATVLISPLAAMFDPRSVPNPEQYIPTRPSHTYLHFGEGTHRCLAGVMAQRAIGELLTQLFAKCRIHRGRMSYDGPVVDRYVVKIEQRQESTNDYAKCDTDPRPTQYDCHAPLA